MKKLLYFVLATVVLTNLFISCTKDVYETLPEKVITKDSIVYVKDTIRITNHDTITKITGLDSVKLAFNMVLNYQQDSTLLQVLATDASSNVPTTAVYKWSIDGTTDIVSNKASYNYGIFSTMNGNHLLQMSVTFPSSNTVYNVVQSFKVNCK